MIKIFEKLLNLLYIKVCYFCGSSKDDNLMCRKCRSKIHYMPPSVLKQINGTNIYACSIYDGVIRELILAFKYKGKKQLASVMAELMYNYWKELSISKEEYFVLPVPIHIARKKERKYNHMDLAVREFCKLTNYKYNLDSLIRIKDTKKQFNLHKQERIKNLKDAFDITQNNMPDKSNRILILDDITSTGITLEEIIKVLNRNGYKNITALTLATPDIWN